MLRFVVAVAGIAVVLAAAWAQTTRPQGGRSETAGRGNEQVRRGEYLVMHVAMCVQCHTPRSAGGELDLRRLLQGAPIPIKSPWPNQEWAYQAPTIAGLPGGWTEQDLARFLQTGKNPNGREPRRPMPPFRMMKDDAEAVAAFLKSMNLRS